MDNGQTKGIQSTFQSLHKSPQEVESHPGLEQKQIGTESKLEIEGEGGGSGKCSLVEGTRMLFTFYLKGRMWLIASAVWYSGCKL